MSNSIQRWLLSALLVVALFSWGQETRAATVQQPASTNRPPAASIQYPASGIQQLLPLPVIPSDTLDWNTNRGRVSADIKSGKLFDLLERIAVITGWHVFVEPDTAHTISAKFSNLPPGEALRLLLGDVNFALVPGATNAVPRLYVFRTSRQNATQLVRPSKPGDSAGQAKLIPNELIVRLKPGAKIDDIARMLGAKVIGRIDGLNAYRLQFDDQAAADAARQQLASNPDVVSVDSNYAIDRPTTPRQIAGVTASTPQLQLKPPPANGRLIVGLVDTDLQPLCDNLNSFVLKPISVAGDAPADPGSPTHGTAMAETLLRGVQAITDGKTSIQVLPVDVYGPNPTTSTFDVANGIVQAVNGGAKMINLSLGSDADSPFLHNVIQQVKNQKIPIFAAAGNQPVTTPFYPAAYPEVSAVTAIDHGQIASYANRGSFVSLGAPGTSAVCYNGQTYMVAGTSASSALTTGVAAGYMDRTQGTVDQMESFIQGNFGVQIDPGQ